MASPKIHLPTNLNTCENGIAYEAIIKSVTASDKIKAFEGFSDMWAFNVHAQITKMFPITPSKVTNMTSRRKKTSVAVQMLSTTAICASSGNNVVALGVKFIVIEEFKSILLSI